MGPAPRAGEPRGRGPTWPSLAGGLVALGVSPGKNNNNELLRLFSGHRIYLKTLQAGGRPRSLHTRGPKPPRDCDLWDSQQVAWRVPSW